MFKGKLSIWKNLTYLILLGVHTFLYVYFLNYSMFNYIVFILSLISFLSLICSALYSFITSKSYFHQFYIGIIISSIPFVFFNNFTAFFIAPEVVILLILFFRGTDDSKRYLQMRVNKRANLFQHDPAIIRYKGPVPVNLAIQMDLVWNPNGTLPLNNENRLLEKKAFSLKIQVIGFILATVFFVCLVLSVSNYYNLFF
ncbi:MAG: hypothetical protein EU531_03495 [Promethearchaeota archaeon]|nr:MAG: hypothetical protein EU531_03495 [Candidatus Lokiarchaeota archaeon]